MCINAGRYCLLDPSPYHDQDEGASGADVVIENLRRACIWKIANETQPGVGTQWWEYIKHFDASCDTEEKFKDSRCIKKALRKAGLDAGEVEDCMHPYGVSVDKENPIMEEQLKDQTGLQLLRLPSLYVDGVHARGQIDGSSMLSMVCAGYGVHNPPEVCGCANQGKAGTMDCVKQGSYEATKAHNNNGRWSTSAVLFVLLATISTVAVAGFVYWQRSQRHMRDQVKSILSEYMPMEDDDEEGLLAGMEGAPMHPAARASAMSPHGFAPSSNFDDNIRQR